MYGLDVVSIAEVCHEANRALQKIQSDPSIPISKHWDEETDNQRASAIHGVEGIIDGNTPAESHQRWMDFKLDAGWKLGPVKDELNKTHPLLVPYDELPESQKIKDQLFFAIVTALAFPEEWVKPE